jgi:DNA-binding CsgD family transcriptional regulator
MGAHANVFSRAKTEAFTAHGLSHQDDLIHALTPAEKAFVSAIRLLLATGWTGAVDAATTTALNVVRTPAIILDEDGVVGDANAAAEAIFDDDVKIRDRRIFVRDAVARELLKVAIASLRTSPRLNALVTDPIIVQRQDKLPVILRIWPCYGRAENDSGGARIVVTLNALGPRPGPPAPILAKTFGLTPSEARLACIIARGLPPFIAAQQLKISRETARNQLKSIFAKTNTHRQSELVALLLQVE